MRSSLETLVTYAGYGEQCERTQADEQMGRSD